MDLVCRLAEERTTVFSRIYLRAWESIGSGPICSAHGKTARRRTLTSFCTSRISGGDRCDPLPDLADLRAHHGITFFAAESLRKFRHVGKWPVGTKLRQRMRIGVGLQPRELGADVDGPIFRVAQKKTLLGSEAVGVLFACFAMQRFLESRVGQCQSTEVRDAFSLDQLAVFVQALLDFIAVELFRHALAAALETLQVFGRPPILQVAARVKLRALVIEAMGDFMPDDRADGAVVVSVIAPGIVERQL